MEAEPVKFMERLERLWGEVWLPEEIMEMMELGEAYLDRGEAEAALRELHRAQQMRPDVMRLQALLAEAEAALGNHRGACFHLQRALELAPEEPALHERLAAELGASGDLAGQMAHLTEVLRLDPTRNDIRMELAGLLLGQGEAQRAALELEKALDRGGGAEAYLLLGQARLAAGELRLAQKAFELAPASAEALGGRLEVAFRREEWERAAALARELDPGGRDRRIQLVLGRSLRRAGRHGEAHEALMGVLSLDVNQPEALWELAALYEEENQPAQAAQALQRVAELDPQNPQARIKGLWMALVAGDLDTARALAPQEGTKGLESPYRAMVKVGGLWLAAREGHQESRDTLEGLADGGEEEALFAAGALAEEEGRIEEALGRFKALAVQSPGFRGLQERIKGVWQRLAALQPIKDIYGLIDQAVSHLRRTLPLQDLAMPAAHVQEEFDRPLLVAVMGEFSSGKSTMVNALLGADLLPMGVTPTTATVNLLRHGPSPMARLVLRSGEFLETTMADLPARIRGKGPVALRAIRHVEILLPLEELNRFTVVDTPGLNSMLPEHEEVAREFLRQADAVIWLFDAGQAGKASEAEALGAIQRLGRKALGVVNKADRLSEGDREAVLGRIRELFGHALVEVGALSARQALGARLGEGDLEQSGFLWLQESLRRHFLDQSRALKARTCLEKLISLLEEAAGREPGLSRGLDGSIQALQRRHAALSEGEREFVAALVQGRARALMAEALAEAEPVARQALELVRPAGLFGREQGLSQRDRAYIQSSLDRAVEGAVQRVIVQARGWLEGALQGLVEEIDQAAQEALLAGWSKPLASPRRELPLWLRLMEVTLRTEGERWRAHLQGGSQVEGLFRHLEQMRSPGEEELAYALRQALAWPDVRLEERLGSLASEIFGSLGGLVEVELSRLMVLRDDMIQRVFRPVREMLSLAVALQGRSGEGEG